MASLFEDRVEGVCLAEVKDVLVNIPYVYNLEVRHIFDCEHEGLCVKRHYY